MWVSCYIYYQLPIERVLIRIVKPLIEELTAKRLVNSFFFIRYNDNANHIRVRLKASSVKMIPKLKSCIKIYLERKGIIEADENSNEIVGREYFKFVNYDPEVERYGGKDGLIISESQFQLSSKNALDIISNTVDWSYEKSFLTALYLNITFTYVLYQYPEECIQFLNYNFKNWLSKGFSNLHENAESLTKHYDTYFKTNRDSIYPIIEAIWNSLIEEVPFDEDWMNNWLQGMKKIKSNIQQTPSVESGMLDSIYDSYIHMNNNRLGIKNRDESLISFLIYKTVSEMYGFER